MKKKKRQKMAKIHAQKNGFNKHQIYRVKSTMQSISSCSSKDLMFKLQVKDIFLPFKYATSKILTLHN